MIVNKTAVLTAVLSMAAASAAQPKAVRVPSIPHRLASPAVAAIQAIKPENSAWALSARLPPVRR